MANPIKQQDFASGMVDCNVSLAPSNSVSLLQNCDCDVEIGSVTSRLGRATIDNQLVDNMPILGLVQHCDIADQTKNKLFAMIDDGVITNADIWDLDGTPLVSTNGTDFTKSLKAYFLNYYGDTLVLNGTDAPRAYNSTTWITTGGVFDLANCPTGYKYPIEFMSKIFLWGNTTTPYRVVYSGVLTNGTVSWTVGNGFEDIEPEDQGGEPTGVGKVPGYLLLFKRRSMHRWNFSSAFPEALVNIGAYSQTSILMAGGLCAFYSDSNENEKGFYVTNGGRPTCISKNNNRPIRKWVDAISATAIVSGYATESIFAWSVGDLVVDGETFSNVVLKYNRVLNQWSIRTYPTEFRCFAPYIVSGVNTIIGGDDDGTVYRIDKTGVYTDAVTTATQSIPWKVRTHHRSWGDNKIKSLIEQVIIRGKNINSAKVNIYVNEDLQNPINQTPSVLNKILSLFKVGKVTKGNTIAVEVSGLSQGSQSFVREIELPDIKLENTYV